jgi:N-carbamoylputrescine amidase
MADHLPVRAATPAGLRVGLAQTDSRLGQVEANVEHHLQWIARARGEGVELLVFPELSLTGYRLLHLTPQVAMRAEAAPLARLGEAAGAMAVMAGFVEEGRDGVLYNSVALLRQGLPPLIHRKIYLPTYGIFQEQRFFGPGRRLQLATLPAGTAGLLICEDLWHPELARKLAVGGASLIIVPSAGPGRIGAGERPGSAESWELVTRSTALMHTCWVAYCNRVGWEEGSFYHGSSHIVRPGGDIAVRAPVLGEHLLIADLDLRDADRLRWKLPLLAVERADVSGPEAPR